MEISEPTKKPLTTREVDSSGDVLATIYSGEHEDQEFAVLRISSKVLTLASPVFRTMFDPTKGFKESQVSSEGLKEIRMMASSETTATIAMNILHHQIDALPKPTEVAVIELYNLATFADYYQLQHILRYLVATWVAKSWESRTSGTDTAKWLWIGITFRVPSIVGDCAQEIFERTNKLDNKLKLDGELFPDVISKYTEAIWDQRKKHIKIFADQIDQQYLIFEAESKHTRVPAKCDLVQLGTLQFLRLNMGFPNNNMDGLTFKELFPMLKSTARKSLGDGYHDCRKHGGSHISCDAASTLTELATKLEKTNLKSFFVTAFIISELKASELART